MVPMFPNHPIATSPPDLPISSSSSSFSRKRRISSAESWTSLASRFSSSQQPPASPAITAPSSAIGKGRRAVDDVEEERFPEEGGESDAGGSCSSRDRPSKLTKKMQKADETVAESASFGTNPTRSEVLRRKGEDVLKKWNDFIEKSDAEFVRQKEAFRARADGIINLMELQHAESRTKVYLALSGIVDHIDVGREEVARLEEFRRDFNRSAELLFKEFVD